MIYIDWYSGNFRSPESFFIKEMDKLGDKYGIFLPKGANYYVEDVGIKLVNKYGEKILHDIAKLNFSNTDRILKEVRK